MTLSVALAAIAALAVIVVLQHRALLSERRHADDRTSLLLTRIQAPQLAPALVELPAEDEAAPQWQDEETQEKVWAAANGTEFLNEVQGLNGDR